MFCLLLPQGMAEIESTYASSVIKLLKSVSYTFHSNVLMQWLGSDPFEELGDVSLRDINFADVQNLVVLFPSIICYA